jgi:hypothetical protein
MNEKERRYTRRRLVDSQDMPVCIIIKEEPSLLTLNIDRSTTQGSHQQIREFFQSEHAHKSNVTSMAIRKAEPETTVARIGGSVN